LLFIKGLSMKRVSMLSSMLATSMLACASPVLAQSAPKEAEPPADALSPDDPSLTTIPANETNPSEADSKAALLEAQIQALQGQIDQLKALVNKATPSWKGAPQFADADAGWTFKVRGRLMVDAGYISKPDNYIANRNLGFNTRVRRFRIGVEGTVPGGLGYKAEVDYANAAVGFGDVILTYTPTNAPITIQIGNQESLDGLEQMTSSRWSSFIERAQINDAFGNTRRLGLTVGTQSKDGLLRLTAGAFAAHSIDASLDNEGYILATRGTYTPYALNGFLHLGFNVQYRKFQSNDNGVASVSVGAPSTNQLARYRARPFLQTTDVRFVDTGNFAAKSDLILGLEAYGVFKSLHLGGEAQLVKVRGYNAGDRATGLNAFAGGSAVTPTDDPTFFGGHFEIGYFLTGETRGYKNGLFDRTKVLKPFDKGGSGAFQLIGRVDYLDLDSNKLKSGLTNNFATGVTSLATDAVRLARGGKQTGYLAGLTWIPTDYVRFLLNYIHTEVQGGPLAAGTVPISSRTVDRRRFSTDAVALRAQIDF
jgi:phosphate-selective porin OprO and OprP